MKNIFSDITFKWYQVSVLKLSLLSLGVFAGAYWAEFFNKFGLSLLYVFAFTSIYLILVWANQQRG